MSGRLLNIAETATFELTLTTQIGFVPLHAPVQPVNFHNEDSGYA